MALTTGLVDFLGPAPSVFRSSNRSKSSLILFFLIALGSGGGGVLLRLVAASLALFSLASLRARAAAAASSCCRKRSIASQFVHAARVDNGPPKSVPEALQRGEERHREVGTTRQGTYAVLGGLRSPTQQALPGTSAACTYILDCLELPPWRCLLLCCLLHACAKSDVLLSSFKLREQ